MVLMVERNREEHLIRGFAGRGNEPDPHGENPFLYVCDRGNHRGGVRKETLCSLGLQVEITECVGKVPSNYHGSLCSLGMRVSSPECVDKAPYYPGFHCDHHDNPLLTMETKSEPIIWDIGDEEEEYPFVNKYISFQEEPIMLVEEESCPVYDTDNEEDAEPAPKYDLDGDELVFEDEEVCLLDVGNSISGSSEARSHHPGHSSNNYNSEKRATSSHAESKSSVEHPEPDQEKRNSKSLSAKALLAEIKETSDEKSIEDDVRQRIAPMDDKLGFKTIKVQGRVLTKKVNLMQGIQVWMLRVQRTSKANSRISFSQAGEDDADALTFSQSQNA
ncbi:reverse transcriptase domain-containing protein [Tanacetum coccineum]